MEIREARFNYADGEAWCEYDWDGEDGRLGPLAEMEPLARALALEAPEGVHRVVSLDRPGRPPVLPAGVPMPKPPDAWRIIITDRVRADCVTVDLEEKR